MAKKNCSVPVLLQDKRDYCLSSLSIKDNNVKDIVSYCDYLNKSIHDLYDSIICNREVVSNQIIKYLNEINNNTTKLKEMLMEDYCE